MSSIPNSPSPLVRLLPVLSSTASVTFCAAEYWAILPQLRPGFSGQSIREWWNGNIVGGTTGVILVGCTSATAGYLGWRGLANPTARRFYGWGALLATAHFLFVPWIAQTIQRMVDGTRDEKTQVKRWLWLHTARMITCDVPALLFFLGGFLHTV